MDPTIRAQLKKVEVVADPEIEKVFPALQRVIVNIMTTDGQTFSKQLDYPKGDPRNPLSDDEIEEKFRALAERRAFRKSAGQADGRHLESGKMRIGDEIDGADEDGY